MVYLRIISGLLFVLISFYLFLLALMRMFPIYVAAPLLYISIVYALTSFTAQKRFKGFHR